MTRTGDAGTGVEPAISSSEARLARAREVFNRDGPGAFMAAALRRYVADRREFFLYQHLHREWPDGAFRPRLEGIESFFVTKGEEARSLPGHGEDISRVRRQAQLALYRGAVAFCVYRGGEVVHVAWLATSAAGRRSLDRLGYEVRFDVGEAWTGAAWTRPDVRNQGLLTYSCHRRFEYLRQAGWQTSRGAVDTGNVASHAATMRFEPYVYAVGCQWRILGRRWWAERAPAPGEADVPPPATPLK